MDNNTKISELTVGELKQLVKSLSHPLMFTPKKFIIKGNELVTVIERAGVIGKREGWN